MFDETAAKIRFILKIIGKKLNKGKIPDTD